MADEYQPQSPSWLDRVKESPRTVSALIIILIVAAAIYAFSGDTNQPGDEPQETPLATATGEASPTPEGETPAPTDTAAPTATSTPAQPVTQEQLNQQAQQLPQPERTDAGFVEVAQAGEGITHLARRATTRWLSENNAGYQITNEHRIFIEDYLQDRVGTEGLALGETKTISYDLIAEAVAAAGQLNQQQLQNLSQYTYVLN